jgi:adenine deaminase
MELWRRAGIPTRGILLAATRNPADYHGVGGVMGRVAPGFVADLVLTKENPLLRLSTLRSPTGVLQGGRYFNTAALVSARSAGVKAASSWRFPFHVLRDLLRNPLGFVGS